MDEKCLLVPYLCQWNRLKRKLFLLECLSKYVKCPLTFSFCLLIYLPYNDIFVNLKTFHQILISSPRSCSWLENHQKRSSTESQVITWVSVFEYFLSTTQQLSIKTRKIASIYNTVSQLFNWFWSLALDARIFSSFYNGAVLDFKELSKENCAGLFL